MKHFIKTLSLAALLASCTSDAEHSTAQKESDSSEVNSNQEFNYVAEQFADLRVLRYQVKDFDALDLKTKTLVYYLYEAAVGVILITTKTTNTI